MNYPVTFETDAIFSAHGMRPIKMYLPGELEVGTFQKTQYTLILAIHLQRAKILVMLEESV